MHCSLQPVLRHFASCCCAVVLCAVGATKAAEGDAPGDIQFNRDVRPIFSDKCFACHGPDGNARQTDLRLDNEAGWRP